jgi:hypothetical protein
LASLQQAGVILGEKGFGFGVPVQHVGAAIEDHIPEVTPVAGDHGGGDLLEQGQLLGLGLAGEDEIRFQIDQLLQVGVV